MTCIADETQFHDPCILMLQTQCKNKKQCSAATRIFYPLNKWNRCAWPVSTEGHPEIQASRPRP